MRRLLLLLSLYFSTLRFLLIGYSLWPLAIAAHHSMLAAVNLACKSGFHTTIICRFADTASSPDRYTDAIHTKFSGLESLVSGATEIAPLAQSLTEARLSIDDLIVVVKLSTLTSRTALVDELLIISSETRQVSRNLQKLSAEIQASVDLMLIVNEHLLGLLQTRISANSLLAVYCHVVGNTLHSVKCSSSPLRIAEAYDQTLHQFQQVLSALLIRVMQVQGNLDSIEARLGVVRDLVTAETGAVMSDKADILSHVLGLLKLPTQRTIRLNGQLQSLRKITHYRTIAVRYVFQATEGLQELEESMEVLRSITLGAMIVSGVPMEVITAALSKGIDWVHGAGRSPVKTGSRPLMINNA